MTDQKLENDQLSQKGVITENNKSSTLSKEAPADFEKAISETKFGLFNLVLLLVTIVSVLASQFEMSSISYVFPAAQCDLDLSLEDRGLINAIMYAGMIVSCFIWGSLVDIFGRRKILIITHLLAFICSLSAAFSPNSTVLIIAKFFGGFIINGPSMALSSYLSEFHDVLYRSRVPLTIGLLFSIGNICLALLAWAILPNTFTAFIAIELHSWNLFLFICALPGLVSGLLFLLLPESPKYLMTRGNNQEALKIFQNVFRLNTRQSKEKYPVKKLIDDKRIYKRSNTVTAAWKQISPLFARKYFTKLALVCTLQLFLMMSINSLRFWVPQIFQLINDYEVGNEEAVPFCTMLRTIESVDSTDDGTCSMNFNNSSVYINSIIVFLSAIFAYIAAALFVNKLGKKRILITLGFASAVSSASIYFAPNSVTGIVLICVYLACLCVCTDIVITTSVDLFPTQLRASALSLSFMFGRIGSVVGNLTFPVLLRSGCAHIFFTLGGASICWTLLSLYLPNTDFTALK